MATSGTPFEGRDNIVVPAVYTSGGLDLRLYTNTANSLSSTTVLADLTFPSGTGYATITLSGNWGSSNGVITYDTNTTFTNSGGTTWTGGNVIGSVITDGTYILHFKDLSSAVEMTAGTALQIDLSTFISV